MVMDSLVCVIQLGGIAFLAWKGWLTIPLAFLVLGMACLFPTAIWLLVRPQPYRIQRLQVWDDWCSSWSYARWLVAARSLGIASHFLVPWIIVWLINEPAAGAYATCANLVGLSLMFVMGLNNFVQPRAVRAYHQGGARALCRALAETVAALFLVLSGLCVVYYFAGGWLLGAIYGSQYAAHGSVVFALGLSMLVVSFSMAAENGMSALGRPRGVFWGAFSYCAVSMLLALMLIGTWQLVGVAVALIGGGIAGSIVTCATLVRLLRNEMQRETSRREG